MSNYIKTLLLSTIVLVMGNNSNCCYSMVDANGNIIENEHFLQDGNYLKDQFNNSKNMFITKLNNLVKSGIYKQGDVNSILNTLNDFFDPCFKLCKTFADVNTDQVFTEQQFEKMTLRKEIHEFIPDDILVKYNKVTFRQLSNYLTNKIYHLMIDSIRKISSITDNNLNINDLKNNIMKEIAQCYFNIAKNINAFLNFCNNNINDKNIINRLRDLFQYYIYKLLLFNKDNNLNSYQYFEELDPNHTGTIKVSENFLNKNYSNKMLDMVSEFGKNISNICNIGNIINIQDPEKGYINIIDEFNYWCNVLSTEVCIFTEMKQDYLELNQKLLLLIDVNDLIYIPELFNYCKSNNMSQITFEQLLNYYANYIIRMQRNVMKNIQHYVINSVQNLGYNIKSEISKCITTIELTINQLFKFLDKKHNNSIRKEFGDKLIDGFESMMKDHIKCINELKNAINAQNNK